MREMRAISFVHKLIDNGTVEAGQMKNVLMHAIEAEDVMKGYGAASKFNVDWKFLTHLRDVGRNCADEWLDANFEHLGSRTTIDIQGKYM